jgi:hypothetical protein
MALTNAFVVEARMGSGELVSIGNSDCQSRIGITCINNVDPVVKKVR